MSEHLEEVRKFIDTHNPPNTHLIARHAIWIQDKTAFDTYVDALRTNPPKIGAIITYQYTGFSKNGIPKHTRFLRIYDE